MTATLPKNLSDPRVQLLFVRALRQANLEKAKLLRPFVDLELRYRRGLTPLLELVDQINNVPQDDDGRYSGAARFVPVLQWLVDEGAEVNVRLPDGLTPAHLLSCHSLVLPCILAAGGDVNALAESTMRWTPLHFAAFNGSLDTIPLLINAGADATLRNSRGATPGETARDSNLDRTAGLISALHHARELAAQVQGAAETPTSRL